MRSFCVDFSGAAVGLTGADDGVAADGDIAGEEGAGREVEDAGVADDQVSRGAAERLIDALFEGLAHGREPYQLDVKELRQCGTPGVAKATYTGEQDHVPG